MVELLSTMELTIVFPMDRVRSLLPGATSRSPEMNMRNLLNSLGKGVIVPRPDKYYVFIYKAKTPGIVYDQHPFILCTGVYKWGFTGNNFHMGPRRYTWQEVLSNIYEINSEEIRSMSSYPTTKIKTS